MSRNTVDFDDLLASLDDLTTSNPPAPQKYDSDDDNKHHGGGGRSRSSSSSSSSSSDDDDHNRFSAPPPPAAAPPPPAPAFKAKAAPAPKAAKPAPAPVAAKPKAHAQPKPLNATVSHQPSHSHASHQSSYEPPRHHASASSHHGGGGHQSSPGGGDLRNYARQSTIMQPSRGSSSDSCNKCGQRFDGEYVSANGKTFHLHHFTCHDCGTQLQSQFFDHRGNTLCMNCAGNLLPCTKCRRGITGQYLIQDNKPFHKECVERWVCAKCHRDVDDVVTSALGQHWHKACFACHKCNAPLGGQFVNDNGRPACQNCANKGLPQCSVCHRELVGDYTNFDGRSFHNECFKCERCHTKLQLSGFYNVGGQHVCERCAR